MEEEEGGGNVVAKEDTESSVAANVEDNKKEGIKKAVTATQRQKAVLEMKQKKATTLQRKK